VSDALFTNVQVYIEKKKEYSERVAVIKEMISKPQVQFPAANLATTHCKTTAKIKPPLPSLIYL
jgi:hypothetical protein